MELNFDTMIGYYNDKIIAVKSKYSFTQSNDNSRIDYKKIKSYDQNYIDLCEDIIEDLKKIGKGGVKTESLYCNCDSPSINRMFATAICNICDKQIKRDPIK